MRAPDAPLANLLAVDVKGGRGALADAAAVIRKLHAHLVRARRQLRGRRHLDHVGEHSAVVWKRVYLSPWEASRSAEGVWHGPPNALEAPKPTSSSRIKSTLGAPVG